MLVFVLFVDDLSDPNSYFHENEIKKIENPIEENSDVQNVPASKMSQHSTANQNGQPNFQAVVLNQRKQKLNQGIEEIKRHRWFISISNWDDVREKRMKPPFRPELMHDGDTRNFEKYETPDFSKTDGVTDKQLEVFCNF